MSKFANSNANINAGKKESFYSKLSDKCWEDCRKGEFSTVTLEDGTSGQEKNIPVLCETGGSWGDPSGSCIIIGNSSGKEKVPYWTPSSMSTQLKENGKVAIFRINKGDIVSIGCRKNDDELVIVYTVQNFEILERPDYMDSTQMHRYSRHTLRPIVAFMFHADGTVFPYWVDPMQQTISEESPIVRATRAKMRSYRTKHAMYYVPLVKISPNNLSKDIDKYASWLDNYLGVNRIYPKSMLSPSYVHLRQTLLRRAMMVKSQTNFQYREMAIYAIITLNSVPSDLEDDSTMYFQCVVHHIIFHDGIVSFHGHCVLKDDDMANENFRWLLHRSTDRPNQPIPNTVEELAQQIHAGAVFTNWLDYTGN